MTITTSIPPRRIRLQAEDAGHPFHGNQWTGKSAADVASHLEKTFPGMTVDFSEGHGKAELSRIVVPEAQRGSGTGTKAMKHLTDWADANGKTVTLSPSSDFGGNKARLVEFYKRFGFVENKGRNKDFSISDTMFREPSKSVRARRAVSWHPLEAAAGPLPGQIERVIVSLQNDGRLPIRIPPETMRHVSESLARYFQTASADKIEQFAEAAKAAVEAELKTVNVQTHDTMKADTTGINVGATPATSRGVLTSFIESATGDNIGGLMNMDFFNRIMREVTQGAGNFVAQNFDQTRLDEFPALELHRVYDREVPRGFRRGKGDEIVPDPDNDWPSRWEAALAESGDEEAAAAYEASDRMVALKSSSVWAALGDGAGGYEDVLGNQFPPFAFNSGFDTDEVSREDAVALGLMDDEDEAKPADFDFSKLLDIEAASAATRGALEAGDVSGEARDEKGRWTAGMAENLWEKAPKAEKDRVFNEIYMDPTRHAAVLKANNLPVPAKSLIQQRRISLSDLKPTQEGEDRINDSSAETARNIKAAHEGKEKLNRWEDVQPILVHGPTGKILDGNHRFTAAVQNGDKSILAYVIEPKGKAVLKSSSAVSAHPLEAASGDVPLVAKCFITDADGRLLVLQADGYGRMDLPGGHLRAGETVEDGLRREVLEETGMTLTDVKELGTVLVPWNGQQPIVFFSAQSDGSPVLSDEHVDWFWLNRHEVALRNFSALNKVVNNFTDGKDLNAL